MMDKNSLTENWATLSEKVATGLPYEMGRHAINSVEKFWDVCESPIEVLLAAAIEMTGRLMDAGEPAAATWVHVTNNASEGLPPAIIYVIPQVKLMSRYRVDFYCEARPPAQPFIIECDGHDFHERTPDQAERDRSRDRALQQMGLPVLRFTGREIHRSARDCAMQVVDFAKERIREARKTA